MPRQARPLTDRVWERIEKRGPEECWPTNGTHAPNGYATFFLAKQDRPPGACRITSLHRVLFFITHSYYPLVVRHSCDQRWCGNPGHLLAGTAADNNRDTRERGHYIHARGERNGHAKLTEEDVRYIRSSPETSAYLARHYSLDPSTISDIRHRKRWKYLE